MNVGNMRKKLMKAGTLVKFSTTKKLLKNLDKVFKNGPSKICGRQPLKNLKECGQVLLDQFLITFSYMQFVRLSK